MKLSNAFGYALLGTCLYGAVMNSFPTNEEKDAVGEIDATNEVERVGCAAALGLKTTLGMTQGEIVAAIRGDQRGGGALASSDMEDSSSSLRRRISTAEGVAKRCLQWCASSPIRMTADLDARPQWRIRGAWDDDYFQAFGAGWVFPFGTNHLSGIVVCSQGGLAASSYDEPFVSLPFPVAMVPREGSFTVEQTSNSTVFAWWNARPGRTACETSDAQIELFRNGDYCVSTNGVVVERFIRGNPYPDVPIGQDDDYRDWVDEQVGVGLTNGLYKFTASFPVDPIEVTLLRVGEESVVVTNAGEYVFLLEKGREYEFETIPYDPTVEYDMCDDIVPLSRMRMMGWWGDDSSSAEWSIGGGENWLNYPTMYWWGYTPGWCCWMPTLQGSPGFTHLGPGDFPITLEAILTDFCGSETPSFQWSGSNDNVTFSNPTAQTTELNCDDLPSWDSLALSVEANFGGYSMWSYLYPHYGQNSEPQVSLTLSVPEVMFTNDDDDDDDGVVDCLHPASGDDDVAVGGLSFHSDIETNATVTIQTIEGFEVGFVEGAENIDDFVFLDRECTRPLREGDSFSLSSATEWGLGLYINPVGHSSGYEDVEIVAKLALEGGEERAVTAKATVVAPVVEPICNATKDVVVSNETRKLAYNPCGVGIGREAYFKIKVEPEDFPNNKIVWEADGGLEFVNGNTGREICVRGTSAGSASLKIRIRPGDVNVPSFPVVVAPVTTIGIHAMIICDDDECPMTEARIREMIVTANEIYEQVCMQFYLASLTVTNLPAAYNILPSSVTNNIGDVWRHSQLTSLMSGTGGVECYFVNRILKGDGKPSSSAGSTSSSGIVMTSIGTGFTFAHEIGHLCGAEDIYDSDGKSHSLRGYVCCGSCAEDWNGGCDGRGAAGTRYYSSGMSQKEIVKTLLMNGDEDPDVTACDITIGNVRGYLNAGEQDAGANRREEGSAAVGFETGGSFHLPICD